YTIRLRMIQTRCLSITLFLACSFACARVNPSATAVTGKWKVEWACGLETLQLKPEGTYTYTIEFAGGGRATEAGQWRIIPKAELFDGARVVLENALTPCSMSGEKLAEPERHDRQFVTIWEWGRMILSFHPDLEGFTRE